MSCAVNCHDPAMCGTTVVSPKLVLEAVNVTVAVNDISILNGVSISAANGELVAFMGPSGSGKTTLLDTIAGRRTPQSGFVKLNGTPMDGKLRRKLGFVLQEDTFFADLTLWETLYFTSMVRLPESIPKAEKVQHIEDLAESLGVKKCLNTRIGDMFNPGLSGGEKKRASIICELLTDPDILLLDEPTSGLDYCTALTLVQRLKKLAGEKNKIIIFSIHQPSSQMYHMFDKLLLLAQGKVAFFGDRSDLLPYLENVGFKCEMQYNPADFLMGILKSDESTIKRLTDAFSNRDGATPLKDMATNDKSVCLSLAVTNNAFILEERDTEVQIFEHNSFDQKIVEETTKWPTSFSTQFHMISWRTFKVSRGRILHLYELLQSMILAVILGLVFFQIPQTIDSIRDRMGLLFITVAHWTFGAAFDAITAFSSERGVITKEIKAKAYRVSAYYLARTLTELPLVLTLPVFFYAVAYWMAGLHGVSQFFVSLLVLLLSTLSAQGFGYMIGAACMDVKFGIFLANTTILFALILSGFITQTLPAWFSWAKYLSFIFHPLSAMSLILLQDMQPLPCNTLSTDMFPQCLTNATVVITGKDVLLRAGITLPIYCYITGLVIFLLLFRILGCVALSVRFKDPK
ncbi:hypothetical protein ACJMK2_025109 [Sinanodonta woodiana]|uniref:ABC transporter domain-containing protein n=1 Tax=Sinanodonta woodiana TaxID=1069815 RepID=A0ABD3XJB2_SINWO